MAAILCRGTTQACGEATNNISDNFCCCEDEQSCCYCGSSCCGCGKYLSTLKHICTNPFGIFVTVTVVSNTPPMLIALTEVGNLQFQDGGVLCHSSLWLLVNFLFCWVHIIASFYIAVSINTDRKAEKHKHHGSKRHSMDPKAIFRRAGTLFCYDPFIAVYMLTVGVYVAFLFVPEVLTLDNDNDNNNSACSQYIHEKVIATVGFAWAFLGFGLGALALSFGFAYVDANRKPRHEKTADAPESGFATHQSDLDDEETQASYTTLEEGVAPSSQSSKHSQSGSRRGGRQAQSPPFNGEQYVPPMILHVASDDGMIELVSTTESNEMKKKRSHRKGNFEFDDNTEGDTVGFVTDMETDAERDSGNHDGVISPASSSKKTAVTGHLHRNGRRDSAGVNYFADEEDALHNEPQEDTETTTEDIEGITDMDRSTVNGTDRAPTFDTSDIDQAIDLTDDEFGAPVANLDIILAVTQDVTLSLTDTDRSGAPFHEDEEEIETDTGIVASATDGSTRSSTGRPMSPMSQRFVSLSLSSQRESSAYKQSPTPLSPNTESLQRMVDLVTNFNNPTTFNMNDGIPTSPSQREQYRQQALQHLVSGTRTSSLEYDPASLTYSTSIGTLGTAIATEPMSFVDGGGGSSSDNAALPYVLESSDGETQRTAPYASLREQSIFEISDGETITTTRTRQSDSQ